MANDLLNPPETEVSGSNRASSGYTGSAGSGSNGHELDAFLGRAFEEKSVWADLYENIHELFFPTRLPPLQLTSTPIPVNDPLAVKWNPTSVAISATLNIGLVLALIFIFRVQIIKVVAPAFKISDIDASLKPYVPPTPKSGQMGGGGGGGSHSIIDPIKGRLPKIDPKPMLAPQVPIIEHPKIAIEPAINIQPNIKLPDNPTLPTIGVSQSPNVTLASNGQGSGSGMGTGKNGGLGSGNGNGYGPGQGGNVGGGLYRVGDGVSAPVAIFQPEAEFSDEARRAKYEGTVVVALIVDAQGNPQNVHISRSLGMGLDEKAMEAVRQYKFKPAFDSKTKHAVPVPIAVEVRFRLY